MPPRLPCNSFSADPRRQAVDEQRCAHRHDKDDDDADDERFHHIPRVDFFLVPVRDRDADADIGTPDHDHARKCHDDIHPERIHKLLQFRDDLLQVLVQTS